MFNPCNRLCMDDEVIVELESGECFIGKFKGWTSSGTILVVSDNGREVVVSTDKVTN